MAYLDVMVAAVKTSARDAYAEHAKAMLAIFREHGATRCVELWGDDVPHGTLTDFHLAVKAQADESVVVSWIEWPDRASRDDGMARSTADPRMAAFMQSLPFDGKRMIFGGFTPLLEA